MAITSDLDMFKNSVDISNTVSLINKEIILFCKAYIVNHVSYDHTKKTLYDMWGTVVISWGGVEQMLNKPYGQVVSIYRLCIDNNIIFPDGTANEIMELAIKAENKKVLKKLNSYK